MFGCDESCKPVKKLKPVRLLLIYRDARLSEQARMWFVIFLMCELFIVLIIKTQLHHDIVSISGKCG